MSHQHIAYNIIHQEFISKNTTFFIGNGNRDFGLKVASHFNNTVISNCIIERFANGEIKIPKIQENIRKRDCIIIQSVSATAQYNLNDLLMELFVLIDAIRRGSATSIRVILPIFPYQRQDRKDYSRAPISSKMVASFLETQGVDRVITFDLHAGQIQGFFDKTRLDNIYTEPYFIHYIKTEILSQISKDDLIIVSPDEGGVKTATRIAKKLDCAAAILYKERLQAGVVDKMILMGNVQGKVCFIMDDIIDTAGTACKAAQVLHDNGAEQIYMGACHGILSDPAITRINNSPFKKVIVSNTVEIVNRFNENQNETENILEKIEIIDVSKICAAAIERSLIGQSLSELMVL